MAKSNDNFGNKEEPTRGLTSKIFQEGMEQGPQIPDCSLVKDKIGEIKENMSDNLEALIETEKEIAFSSCSKDKEDNRRRTDTDRLDNMSNEDHEQGGMMSLIRKSGKWTVLLKRNPRRSIKFRLQGKASD
jgi:hypothetical protein